MCCLSLGSNFVNPSVSYVTAEAQGRLLLAGLAVWLVVTMHALHPV